VERTGTRVEVITAERLQERTPGKQLQGVILAMYSILSFGAVLVGSLGFVGAISPLSITGSKFFNAAGQQVFFKGSSSPSFVLDSFCAVLNVRYFLCLSFVFCRLSCLWLLFKI